MNDMLWSFWTFYITILLSTLGLFMSVIVTTEGVFGDLMFIATPGLLLIYMVLFCAIGQHVKDSVAEVQVAAYDCEWYAAPIPFRKLVLMLLIRCSRESTMDARPFFDMDFVLLAKVGMFDC